MKIDLEMTEKQYLDYCDKIPEDIGLLISKVSEEHESIGLGSTLTFMSIEVVKLKKEVEALRKAVHVFVDTESDKA